MQQIDLHLGAEKLTALADRLHFTASANGICRVALHPSQGWRGMPQATGPVGKLLRQARREVAEYLAGARAFFNVPVDLSQVPEFERAALAVAARIPYGEVRTYRWIATQLGKPDAARAVGGAMAGNPIPLIVPCHRVVRTDGGLGGYSFGLIRKEALLSLERSTAPFVGCVSTKIFCRRGCEQERRNREDGWTPFLTTTDAASDGYRPCCECHPV